MWIHCRGQVSGSINMNLVSDFEIGGSGDNEIRFYRADFLIATWFFASKEKTMEVYLDIADSVINSEGLVFDKE